MFRFIYLASLVSFAGSVKPALHYSVSCQILNQDGVVIRRFPGFVCRHLPDGRVLSFKHDQLRVYDAQGERTWRVRGHFHHYSAIESSEKTALVLSSSFHDFKGQRVRFDRVSRYDLASGKEISFFDFFENRDELWSRADKNLKDHLYDALNDLQAPPPDATEEQKKSFRPTTKEFSHANSVQEIPENNLGKKNPIFRKGNILVNVSALSLILILDSKLEKILWSMSTTTSPEFGANLHDVQLLKNGKFLVYNNRHTLTSSAIEEIDPVTKKRKLIYRAAPPEEFFAPMQGGVQKPANGNYLISEFRPLKIARFFEIDPAKKTKLWTIDFFDSEGKVAGGLQDVRQLDLTDFLKNNLKGPSLISKPSNN